MTNGEKYKTAQERAEAFEKFCSVIKHPFDSSGCDGCELRRALRCEFFWLDLEAEEEKPLPCPFCGSELEVSKAANTKSYGIHCGCGYYAPWKRTKHEAIAAHNRVAKAVRESEGK